MNDSRYQYQSRFVKALRWLQWKPVYAVAGLWQLARWAVAGLKIDPELIRFFPTRWEMAKSIWRMNQAMCEGRMGHWYTGEEVIASIKRKSRSREIAADLKKWLDE